MNNSKGLFFLGKIKKAKVKKKGRKSKVNNRVLPVLNKHKQVSILNKKIAPSNVDFYSTKGIIFYKINNLIKQYSMTNNLEQKTFLKLPLKAYDKVFYYYKLQTPINMYAHKAFILLEMQLNASLIRAKLVPYLFMARDFCFYRLVKVNELIARNPHQVVGLYDTINVPIYLYNYMYYRQYRVQYYPANITRFFKHYWSHFTNYASNKVWLLTNFVTSDITATAIIFEFPNIGLYMGPFRRFTKLYYRNQPYAPTGKHKHLNFSHTVLKLKLFEYASFYR